MTKIAKWQLQQRQAQPLLVKIQMSIQRIKAWHEHWNGEVYVAFSGGLDSTVLLHLVRSVYPDVPAVFVNTRMEYPENVRFVHSTPDVHIVHPKMHFQDVLERYGYPVISKRVAQYVHEVQHSRSNTPTKQLRLTGIRSDGTFSYRDKIPDKWMFLLDAPFRTSDRCCYVMKKNPMKQAEKTFGHPFIGTRVEESTQRELTYYTHGCNAFHLKRPRSTPVAFWMDRDIVQYLKDFDVPYSPLYDMGCTRSGCMFCMFGLHLEREPNRFQRMQRTHPKQWQFCMERLGLKDILFYLNIPYQLEQQYFDFFWNDVPLIQR